MTEHKKHSGPSKRGKWIFALAAIAIAVFIVLHQRRSPPMPPGDWIVETNPAAVLPKAKEQNRKVLMFFASKPWLQGSNEEFMINVTLTKNRQNIAKANVICVYVPVGNLQDSPVAKEFRITQLPTSLLLSPNGIEIRRGEGRIGQSDFNKIVLDGQK
ncbi:MAG: hypothetical protein ABFD92_06595 [Planctomycetaceae bacterium]|nr:hypothetical protein [Planctomycetaceae bacterium]